eukprot:gene22113-28214_t
MEEHISTLGKSNERASKYVRGLGYVSQFHRDLAYSPKVLELLSDFADEKIVPHSMMMNISHCNIGEIATGKPVDKWHVDSVDYVLIVILSDLTDMVGGELRVLQQPNDKSGTFFSELSQKGIPPGIPIETVNYIGAGYGLFMQGSKIFHTVNGVRSAREPRISLVNSYMSARPFAEDLTRYNTFADGSDGKEVSDVEYARHKAWRIKNQMQYLLDNLTFTNSSSQQISDMLFNASTELAHAAHLIQGEENDNARWIDELELLRSGAGSGQQSPKIPTLRQSPQPHSRGSASGGSTGRHMRALSLSPMRQKGLLSHSFSQNSLNTVSSAVVPILSSPAGIMRSRPSMQLPALPSVVQLDDVSGVDSVLVAGCAVSGVVTMEEVAVQE